MAAYQCLNCGEIDRGQEDCCDKPELFCVNDMPEEIQRLRALVRTASDKIKKRCAQCGVTYTHSEKTTGCPKCAPGVKVVEEEFRKPLCGNPAQAPNWAECLRISESPKVDEALRLFAQGETSEDQAVCIVRAVLETYLGSNNGVI